MRIIQPPRKSKSANRGDKQTEDCLIDNESSRSSANPGNTVNGKTDRAVFFASPTSVSSFNDSSDSCHSYESCRMGDAFENNDVNNISNKRTTTQAIRRSRPQRNAQEHFDYLLEKGVRLLSMREHSTKELTEKLRTKSSVVDANSADIVTSVIEQLVEYNYLSDERFTETYVRSRANRGFGPIKIRSELGEKGIASDLIDLYLDPDAAIWFDNASLQYQKKYGSSEVADYRVWSKRARFMQSRGFTSQQIRLSLPQMESE